MQPAVSYIGLEVTSAMLRGARVNGAGRSIAVYNEPITRNHTVEGLVEQLVSAAKAVDGPGNEAARAVGVAIPGVVAGKAGQSVREPLHARPGDFGRGAHAAAGPARDARKRRRCCGPGRGVAGSGAGWAERSLCLAGSRNRRWNRH